LATQRPDGDALPPKVRDLAIVKFCLKVPDQVSNDMILGTAPTGPDTRASEFRPKIDAGLGWFKGEGDPQAVRTYYLDLNDTAKIAARARAMREAAGVLSGYALGQTSTEQARSFAADVLTVFAGAPGAVVRDDRRPAPRAPARDLRRHHPGGRGQPAPQARHRRAERPGARRRSAQGLLRRSRRDGSGRPGDRRCVALPPARRSGAVTRPGRRKRLVAAIPPADRNTLTCAVTT